MKNVFQRIFLLLLISVCLCGAVSAEYSIAFDADDLVHANQTITQDPTHGQSVPWVMYLAAGFIGLGLIVLALIRPKSQRMDYEVNIILSLLSWPFVWYWTWGGLTSVVHTVGFAGVVMSDKTVAGAEAAFMTQHIIYSFWVLGWIGVGGCVFAAFVTALLIAQYNLFKDNEAAETAKRQQKDMMDEKQ